MNKKPPRRSIPRLFLLFLTLRTIPLFRQIFLINTIQMKPLTLTIWIFAHDHLAKRCAKAITICWLFGVVCELLLLLLLVYGWVYYAVCDWWCVVVVGRGKESAAFCALARIPTANDIIHRLQLTTSINCTIIPTNTLPPLIIKHLPLLLCLLLHFCP